MQGLRQYSAAVAAIACVVVMSLEAAMWAGSHVVTVFFFAAE